KRGPARVNRPAVPSTRVDTSQPRPPPPLVWHPERYRPLLRLLALHLHRDPRLRPRFDASDVVQAALVRAHVSRDQFLGKTEPELVRWLQQILNNTFTEMV